MKKTAEKKIDFSPLEEGIKERDLERTTSTRDKRTLSDTELIKEGARYDKKGNLITTREQKMKAWKEMRQDIKKDKEKEVLSELDSTLTKINNIKEKIGEIEQHRISSNSYNLKAGGLSYEERKRIMDELEQDKSQKDKLEEELEEFKEKLSLLITEKEELLDNMRQRLEEYKSEL